MTLVAAPFGVLFPHFFGMQSGTSTVATLDAATEKAAHIGRIYIDGRPTAAKTLSTGTIAWRTTGVTFANGGTTVDIGIQDVATGAGPIAQPDGTFDVKTTLTGSGSPSITANAWQTTTMNSGSKSITHGDLIAVVWDMTAKAGADSVTVTPTLANRVNTGGFPTTNAFESAAWKTSTTVGAALGPNVVITFDDGTLAIIDSTIPTSSGATDTWTNATNPDERGMMFRVPWKCKADALWFNGGLTDAASDFTIKFYSDPTGTPQLLASIAVPAENLTLAAANTQNIFNLATEVALSVGTDYGVTILATGTTNTRLTSITLGANGYRVFFPGSTTLKKITRDGSSGAFTAEVTPTTMYMIGLRISQLDDGMGTPPPNYVLGI